MRKIYSILFLFLMFSQNLYASCDEEDIPIFTERLHSSPKMSSNRVILSDSNASDEEDDIPILSERLHSSPKMSSNSVDGNASDEKDDITTQEERSHGSHPYTSQILKARHPEGENQIDSTNPRRGEGLPYKYTKSLKKLVKEYQEKKWDGQRLDLSHGSYSGEEIEKLLLFRDLEALYISGTPLSAEDIGILAKLQHLQEVHLDSLSKHQRRPDLLRLSEINSIKALSLKHNSIKDEVVKVLSSLPHLAILDLSCNTISDEGARHIPKLRKLSVLVMHSNAITINGAKQILSHCTIQDVLLDIHNPTKASMPSMQHELRSIWDEYQHHHPICMFEGGISKW